MPHEYEDHPVTSEAIETVVTLTVELRSRRQSMSIEELATEAVGPTFHTRVTGTANTNPPEHAGLMRHPSRRSDGERIRTSRFRPRSRHLITQSM
jgi:hypothetical protein